MNEKIEKIIDKYNLRIDELNDECNVEMEDSNLNFAYHKSGQIKSLKIAVKDMGVVLKLCNLQNVMPSLLDIDFLKLRKQKGLTLRQVQDETGISNAYLSQLETGKIKGPGYNVVKALYELYSNGA